MRVLVLVAANVALPPSLFAMAAMGTLLVGRPALIWYFIQGGIVVGAAQFYVSTGPHEFPMSAMLFVAGLVAFAVTDLSVRGYDWVRRRRLARFADRQPERVERPRPADRDLQRRVAGSVEFRRAVEGTQRQIEG